MLSKKPADVEELGFWLVEYGKQMFSAGKAYGRYSETISAVAGARPHIKRQLGGGGAWDLAFAWLADEPHDFFRN